MLSPKKVKFSAEAFSEKTFVLHPIQQNSCDAITRNAQYREGRFIVPARTTAVFVET